MRSSTDLQFFSAAASNLQEKESTWAIACLSLKQVKASVLLASRVRGSFLFPAAVSISTFFLADLFSSNPGRCVVHFWGLFGSRSGK